MSDESTGNLPAVVTKAYDVLLWLINHVGKFPRSHQFVLGDRIESRMLSVLESAVSLCVEMRSGKILSEHRSRDPLHADDAAHS